MNTRETLVSVSPGALLELTRYSLIGEVAPGFAHDTNNPLTAVIGFSELLLMDANLAEDVRESLQDIYQGAQKTKKTISGFQTLMHSLKNPELTEINVDDALDFLFPVLDTQFKKVQANFQFDHASRLGIITCPRDEIFTVLLNLVVVFRDIFFKGCGGNATFAAERKEDHIVFEFILTKLPYEVSDDLIAEIKKPYVFFGEKQGLGLSSAIYILEERGGGMDFEKGADFFKVAIRFPVP